MPKISESVTINANIEDVFDLISRVEEFPLYATMLKEVREIGIRTYRWTALVRGVTLTWDSIIAEFHRPTRLAWRSIRGFKNSGAYNLISTPNGTRVELTIEYNFAGGPLDGLMGALTIPLARTAAASILAKVRGRLEHPHATKSATESAQRKWHRQAIGHADGYVAKLTQTR